MHRLRRVRTGMPRRGDQAGHRAGIGGVVETQSRVFSQMAKYHDEGHTSRRCERVGWRAGQAQPLQSGAARRGGLGKNGRICERGRQMNDDILAALKTVIDPELGINIVDLGLIYRSARTANGIDIALTMTTPACPLGEMMTDEIKLVLRDRFPDLPDVRVEIVWDPPWSPELMSEESRRQLGML